MLQDVGPVCKGSRAPGGGRTVEVTGQEGDSGGGWR